MHEEWTDKLSEYLDGELADRERKAVESHVAQCEPCAAVLDDLRRVATQARALVARPPHDDLWPAVAARIDAPAPAAKVVAFASAPRKVTFTVPQLAAAAVLLMAVSGGLVWSVAGRPEGLRYFARASHVDVAPNDAAPRDVAQPFGAAPGGGVVAPGGTTDPSLATVSFADAQYDAAVAELQRAVLDGRGHLDANTVAIVEHNLQLIDQAIEQARQALASDPANSYLSNHLLEARRRKLELLRRTAEMTSESN